MMAELVGVDYTEAVKRAADILKKANDVLIISHSSPDGDTLGSAFALYRALLKTGRRARVECSDELPDKYNYIYVDMPGSAFTPDLIVSSDIASQNLLGENMEKYKDSIALCIDHHPSNTFYAGYTLLDTRAAATCEIMFDVITLLNVEIDQDIANCIYTGLATDTGCFRYSNTTPKTLRTAALMIEKGAQAATINKAIFETTSKRRMAAETMALASLEYHFDGRAALICITHDICEKTGVSEAELEGIPSIPARIEGVLAGVTVKEKSEDCYKISVRTTGGLNASDICARLGGGGHVNAAGCTVEGSRQEAKNSILAAVGWALGAE
jgi:phosphoesterase RecJ-like protein